MKKSSRIFMFVLTTNLNNKINGPYNPSLTLTKQICLKSPPSQENRAFENTPKN